MSLPDEPARCDSRRLSVLSPRERPGTKADGRDRRPLLPLASGVRATMEEGVVAMNLHRPLLPSPSGVRLAMEEGVVAMNLGRVSGWIGNAGEKTTVPSAYFLRVKKSPERACRCFRSVQHSAFSEGAN